MGHGHRSGARHRRPGLAALIIAALLVGLTPRPALAAVGPDLSVSVKNGAPSVVAMGDRVAAEFTITNAGDAVANNVAFQFPVSPTAELVSVSPTPLEVLCDFNAQGQLTCTFPISANLPPGSFAQYVITFRAVGGGPLVTSGTATSTDTETNTANNTAIASNTVAFTVNSTDDVVDRTGCTLTHCSLREAITGADLASGPRLVWFRIGGTGPFTIAPTSLLPALTDGVTLDATTQTGFAGPPLVFLDGGGLGVGPGNNALTVSGGLNAVRGLAIGNFTGSAIVVSGNSNTIAGNFIGTDTTGRLGRANGGSSSNGAVYVTGNANTVGGPNPADANVVSGNAFTGIEIRGMSDAVIGNLVGTTRDGAGRLGNKVNGIYVHGVDAVVQGNVVRYNLQGINFAADFGSYSGNASTNNTGSGITGSGSDNYFSFNTISGNGSSGVFIGYPGSRTERDIFEDNTVTGNTGDGFVLRGPATDPTEITDLVAIRRGSITNNTGKGIDLAFGANSELEAPTITQILGNAATLTVSGTGRSSSTIDVFADGADEGAQYLGSVVASADGFWTVSNWNEGVDLAALWKGLTGGTLFIRATQTRPVIEWFETSEFQRANPALTGVVSGIAQCTINNTGTPVTYTLPFATVQVYSGGALLTPPSPITADANASFTVTGLAPNSQYRFVYTGQITTAAFPALTEIPVLVAASTLTISCAIDVTTDGTGGIALTPPPAIRNLRNHTWLSAYDLSLDKLGVVTHNANGELVLSDRLFKQGQSNWFKFPVRQGQRVVANLRDLPADYSLALYKDLHAMLLATTTATLADVNRLTAAMSPDELSPDELSPDELSPDELSPDELSPDELSPDELSPDELSPDELSPDELSPDELSPDELSPDELSPDELSPDELSADGYSSVQTRGLLGVSAHAGLSPELIARHTWDNSGYFYLRVRVAAVSGATVDAGRDFTISARAIDSDCIGQPLTKAAPATAGTPGVQTLFVTHTGRLPGISDPLTHTPTAAAATFLSRVQAFAATLPSAAVVDLNNDGGIQQNYARWDAAPTCAAAANIVADSIHDLVATYRSSALKYVVILGGNLTVPAHLVPDQAGLGNERSFTPPVKDDSASKASLATGYFASYDFYASFASISRYDHDLYLPDPGVAVGVVVESSDNILAALDAYTASGGVQRPTSDLVTGYDFLSYVAQDAQGQLAAPGVNVSTLIEPPGLGPTNAAAWSADDMRARLFGTQRYGLIDLNAHFSANRMLAADSTTRLLSTEIANVTDGRFRGTFVLASSCHIGYNIQDHDAITGVTQPLSFPEVLLQQGATLIGSTGYGYHDTFTPKYTGRLVSLVLTELRYDSGPVPAGVALSNAKRDYVQELSALRGIDEKALSELTLYGLPFFAVNLPANRVARPATAAITPVPGASAGLGTFDVTPGYTLTRHDDTLRLPTGGYQTVSYFDANGDVSTTPAQPVLPRSVNDVRAPGYAARGAVLVSADYTDVSGFRPRVDVATTEVRGLQPEFVSSVRTPVLPFALNNFDHASLVATPMQYVSAQGPTALLGTGTARTFQRETIRVVYSSLTGGAADAAAPVLYGVSLTQDGTKVHVDVAAGALLSVGIEGILATYTAIPGTNSLYGHFRSIALAPGAPITNPILPGYAAHYTGDIETAGTGVTPADVRLLVQAIGGNGLVSYRTAQGNLLSLTSETATAAAPKMTTALALTAPSSATYETTVNVSARLTNPSGSPIAGTSVSFKLEGARAKATTDANGVATASLEVAVYPSPAPYQIEASSAEDASHLGSGASQDVVVGKAGSQIALLAPAAGECPAAAPAGARCVQYSDQVPVAVLRSGQELLHDRAVVISLPDGRKTALLTDGYGRVMFDTLDFGGVAGGPATYPLTIAFDGDDGHDGNTSTAAVVYVVAEGATVAITIAPQPVGTVTVSAQVTQDADRAAGDLSRATLTFTFTSDTGVVTKTTVPVSATGAATASLPLPAGVYAVDATLDGRFFAGSASGLLAVFDTSTSVTGGGFIDTTSASAGLGSGDRATFAFNVRFKDGSTTPVGMTRIKIRPKSDRDEHEGWDEHKGRIDFRATSYDWLVVETIAGGRRGSFEGTGTLNGVAGWHFRVVAQDLAQDDDAAVKDTIEIRIWDATGSYASPTYSVSGPIGGGQIKVR